MQVQPAHTTTMPDAVELVRLVEELEEALPWSELPHELLGLLVAHLPYSVQV